MNITPLILPSASTRRSATAVQPTILVTNIIQPTIAVTNSDYDSDETRVDGLYSQPTIAVNVSDVELDELLSTAVVNGLRRASTPPSRRSRPAVRINAAPWIRKSDKVKRDTKNVTRRKLRRPVRKTLKYSDICPHGGSDTDISADTYPGSASDLTYTN